MLESVAGGGGVDGVSVAGGVDGCGVPELVAGGGAMGVPDSEGAVVAGFGVLGGADGSGVLLQATTDAQAATSNACDRFMRNLVLFESAKSPMLSSLRRCVVPTHQTRAQHAVGRVLTGCAAFATVAEKSWSAGGVVVSRRCPFPLNINGWNPPAAIGTAPALNEVPAASGITNPTPEESQMLHYAVVFFVIALIAAVFGFGGIAAGAAEIAKILFFIFIIIAAVTFVMSLIRKS